MVASLHGSLFETFFSELMQKDIKVVLTQREVQLEYSFDIIFQSLKNELAKINIAATRETRSNEFMENVAHITLTRQRVPLRRSARNVSNKFPKYERVYR